MFGLGLVSVLLLSALLYVYFQWQDQQAEVKALHVHLTRTAIISVSNDLARAERILAERGEMHMYSLASAQTGLRQVEMAASLYMHSTGQRLFPYEMHVSMSNAISDILAAESGKTHGQTVRNLSADWKLIYETYTDSVLKRADKGELDQAYKKLVQSLKTPMRP